MTPPTPSAENTALPAPAAYVPPIWNRLVFIFSIVGLLVASYLWNLHSHPADIPCGPSHGCEIVANSRYSQFPPGAGPPVAAYGTIGYLAIAILSFLRTLPTTFRRDRSLLILVILCAALGTLVSLSLTYAELFIIKAICKWCVGSQIIIALLFVFGLIDLLRGRSQKTVEYGK